MRGRMGRAEVLAAVALVVGAAQEPVSAFRRLAAEDPSLGVLSEVADRCAAGLALPEALVASGLLARRDAAHLTGLPPAALAEELTRSAERIAWPPTGEVLARWLPAWVVLAATIPSLVIGAVVAVVGGALYGGVWHSLGIGAPTRGPALWWLLQVADAALALFLTVGVWWVLCRTPLLRRLTVFSRALRKARACAEVVLQARAGQDARTAFHSWAATSGDPRAVQQAFAACGGDVTTTLMHLGVIPRDGAGKPQWDVALAEVGRIRTVAAQALAPWLIAVLVAAGVHGFMTWELMPLKPFSSPSGWETTRNTVMQLLASQTGALLKAAGCAVIATHLLLIVVWMTRRVSGPASDWPVVADRVARALERREDLDHVLRGLRLAVDRPMRQRLDRALANTTDPQPGSRLVHAGVIPPTQARSVACAAGADLPTLLRSASQVTDDHGLRAAANHATSLLALAIMLTLMQAYLLVGVFPKFRTMFDALHQDGRTISSLAEWATQIACATLIAALLGGLLMAWGHRRGWWIAGGGWARLSRGLVLRRLLATGADENTLARALIPAAPHLANRLTDAGQHGDLPRILAIAGWPTGSAAELDRALAADLIQRDRRRARLAVMARVLLPVLIALPISLTAVAVALTMTQLTRAQIDLAAGRPTNHATLSGGTPGMALIFWWTRRCEEQGAAAVEAAREQAQPTPPAKPAPVRTP